MNQATNHLENPRYQFAILGVILLVGVGLRFYGLASQSLWNDELSSWARSNFDDLSTVIKNGALNDVHPPGFHLLLYYVEKYLGECEFWLRLPSAVFGSLAILFLFLLGKRLFTYREGLISAALLASLYFPLYYSQECRSYASLMCFTIISSHTWIAIYRKTRRGTRAGFAEGTAYVLSALAAAYLHYFGLFMVGLQGLALLAVSLKHKPRLKNIALIYGPIVLAYMPWALAAWNSGHAGGIEWIKAPTLVHLTEFNRYLYNRSGLMGVLAGLIYVSPLILKFRAQRKKLPIGKFFPPAAMGSHVLLAWLLVPLLSTWLISIFFMPIFTFRNLIIVVPAAYLLLARCFTFLPFKPKTQFALVGLFVAIGFFELFVSVQYFQSPHKEQFREAAQCVADGVERYPESKVIAFSHTKKYFDYYLEKNGSRQRVSLKAGNTADIARVEKILASTNAHYFWYLRGHIQPQDEFMRYLHSKLRLIEHQQFIGADVWLFSARD